MRRGRSISLTLVAAVLLAIPLAGVAGGGRRPIGDHLAEHGWNPFQIDAALANGWNIDGLTQMYRFGDDPLSVPTVSEEDAAGTVPIAIGVEYVRYTDPGLLPPPVDQPTLIDGKLLIPFGDGPLEANRDYVWFWAEMKDDIPFDKLGVGINIAWPFYVRDADRWESVFKGDTWIGASHIPVFFGEPTSSNPLAFTADLFSVDGSSLNSYQGAGGLAWLEGSVAGMYVPVDAFMGAAEQHIMEYGYAADITIGAQSQFDSNAPRKVTVYPANFTADGRQGGLEPVDSEGRFPINIGFAAYSDITSARLIRDAEDNLWAVENFLKPWPLDNTATHFFDEYFSLGVGAGIAYGDMSGPLAGTDFHDRVHSLFGIGPEGEFMPTGMNVMSDGSLRINLDYKFSNLAAATDTVTLFTFGAFWKDETTTERQSVDRDFEISVADIPLEDPGNTDLEKGVVVAVDLVTGEQFDTAVPTVTEDETVVEEEEVTPTPTPTPITEEPTPAPTTTVIDESGTCWWCWGVTGLFLVVLLAILYIWLKSYDWWTCWIPWFIVIFAWVPFLLAGMWWWRPTWWWVPLLAWFPIIGGYTWYWAQKRTWWQPWYLYVVGGYLAALVVGMVVVGAPEWGLLFPLFWVPWVAFYVWFRGSRQPWWQPWMWGLIGAYVVWNFVWVISLSLWWAWWLPFAAFGLIGWWFVSNGYSWQVVHAPKWCWVVPFTMLPFFAWWIPLWGPWWCFVIIAFLALTLFCAIFNHFKEEEWWSCWLPWFLVIWVGIPFLLMGLWFFQPNWWWLPLLAWFVVVPGYAYWWGQRRSWWLQWHWYVVGGYLAAAALLMVLVGSPTWGLLFPVFWLGPAGFYLWYRPRRQPWFQPWMWGLFAAYVGFFFWWAINLSPFWGGWFPFFFFPFFGWWGVTHGYTRDLWLRKATAIVPMALLPWMGYMLAIYCL